jgi:hypothetical protein
VWAVITIAIIAGLIALTVFIFLIPIDMTFSVERYGKTQTRLRVLLLFGLLHKELGKKKKAVAEKKRKRQPGFKTIFEILRTRGFSRKIANLLKEVVKSIRIKEVSAYFRIGFENAADTGFLFSILGPVVSLFNNFTRCSVRLEPSFNDEVVFEGYFNGKVRLQPIRLISPFARFVFSRPALKVMKVLFLSRWKKQ